MKKIHFYFIIAIVAFSSIFSIARGHIPKNEPIPDIRIRMIEYAVDAQKTPISTHNREDLVDIEAVVPISELIPVIKDALNDFYLAKGKKAPLK